MNPLRTIISLAKWKCHIWLPDYLKRHLFETKAPEGVDIHVMVAVVDHYEPSKKLADAGVGEVRKWCDAYERAVSSHTDSDGVFLQHTWFYRYDYPNFDCIKILSEYVLKGFGEIEFHLHHGNDTSGAFEKTIKDGLEWFNGAGAMLTAEDSPKRFFGYIAGNWALDNGRFEDKFSGVNDELYILGRNGCYADFTFPAFGNVAQPRLANRIFYAKDTPEPKSYDSGVEISSGGETYGDLMIFQGPLHIDWMCGYIEYAALESFTPYFKKRIDYWMKAAVSVKNRPEWVFIKLHTHGMQSRDVFLGEQLSHMLTDLEERFKKPPFKLHYVTARECYNIAKAAEAGMTGDPGKFRDFLIKKPANRHVICNRPFRLIKYGPEYISLEVGEGKGECEIFFKGLELRSIKGGNIRKVALALKEGSLLDINIAGEGRCVISLGQVSERPARELVLPFAGAFF